MGALFGGKSSKATQTVQQTVPSPQPVAEAAEVATVRKAEDEELFGGSRPDLRVDRPSDASAATRSSGSGLRLM